MASRRRVQAARQTSAFDPLGLDSLQRVLRERLEGADMEDVPPTDFLGAGVYALYYVGALDLYAPLTASEVPIYVGKAEAGNSSYGEPAGASSLQLIDRIRKHAQSILEAGETLSLSDFRARYLVVDDAWIVLAERALLREYRPVVWNNVMPGFGANPPGTARRNARSIWDTIHPGRPRAGSICHRRFTLDEMVERVGLAVSASVLEEGRPKAAAIDALTRYSRPPIWRPKRSRETGPDVVVNDELRFTSEMERMNLGLPDYEVLDAAKDPEPDDDDDDDDDDESFTTADPD